MEKAQRNYLSIGDFAEASWLLRKALQLYDERNILRPAYVDPESGYRYYQPDQLTTARLIRALRQIEMPLITIPASTSTITHQLLILHPARLLPLRG
jgi:DNA-binding transcriptional MerR regulator